MTPVSSVITFKWRPRPGYRSTFTGHHVNVMSNMVRRHYPAPHRFICFTDDDTGIDRDRVEVLPLWDDHANVPNPTWPDGPSCYRRLKVFSRDFGDIVGPRFVCLDLDMVITRDLRPLWDRPEPFLIWKPGTERVPMCASMFLLNSGSHPEVWEWFDPARSPVLSTEEGCRGSDQGWITFVLGRDAPGWTKADGVYSWPRQIADLGPARNRPRRPEVQRWRPRHVVPQKQGPLPHDCRVAVFTGKPDPWEPEAQEISPWITDHYR